MRWKAAPVTLAVMLLCRVASVQGADEFSPFALTAYEGYVSTGFVSDEFIARQPGFGGAPGSTSTQTQSDLRVEAFLMTHSHFYHPKFIALDVGGGPILQAGRAENDVLTTRSKRGLYNLSARATVLADKPYNGSVFYEHLNPTLLLSPGEIFNQQTDKYGLNFALLAPVTPVPLNIEASRSHTTGHSVLRVVDDHIDHFALRAERELGTFGRTQLGYNLLQQASSSGSPNLPIQNSHLRSQSLNADTHLQFGASRQYDLFNTVMLSRQEYSLELGRSPRLDDLRLLLHYRGVHSGQMTSFLNYGYTRNEQDSSRTASQSVNTGAVWTPTRSFATSAGLHGEDTQAPQFTLRNRGVDGSVRYERGLPFGAALQASYALRTDQREQKASATQAAIVGERLLLSGTTPVALARTNVVSGSVVVSNAARTQVFIEGLDYALSVVGVTTRVQRFLAGNILDGQELLVDYTVDVGGTYASTQFDQNLDLNLSLSRALNLYFRYNEAVPRVTSGAPTSALNTVHSTLYGVRGDLPLQSSMALVLGGFVERENRRETISPFVRAAGEIYAQGNLALEGQFDFRTAVRRTRVSADQVLQNVDLRGYDISLGWRYSSALGLSANALSERDVGGPEARDRQTGALRAQWRFRRLALTADLSHTRESQGLVVRERNAAHLVLRRDY